MFADPELEGRVEIIAKKVAEQEHVEECRIKISAGSNKGDGFVGILSAVTISGQNKTLNLMVKTAHTNADIREISPIRRIFLREISFYNEIYPAFVDFQRERTQILTSIPQCYGTDSSESTEMLVLENLKARSFQHWDRKVPMNEAHLKMAMIEYGKFHAVSYAMKIQTPDVYMKLTEQFKDDLAAKFLALTMPVFTGLIDKVKSMFKADSEKEIAERLMKHRENLQSFFDENIADRVQNKLDCAVIVHGDCWCNNLMFKYNDSSETSVPSEIKLLDFQIVGENSPVFDLSHFFYTAATGADIADYERYLQVYHDSFMEAVTRLGCAEPLGLTFDALLNHWRKYSRYGLTMAMLVIKVMLAKNHFAVATKSAEAEYERRIKELVLHFYENEFI